MFNVYNRYTDTAGNLHFTDCYEKHGREHIIRADGGAGMSELIDRGDVLGVISCFFEDSFIEDADVNCAELERETNRLPTIDAVPVCHGEWIKRREFVEDMPFTGFRCSICNWWKGDFETYMYCPICGARMDGERREG